MEVEQILSLFHFQGKGSSSSVHYAKYLFKGIVQYKKEIDSLLSKESTAWHLHRMPLVDRNYYAYRSV